MTGSGKGRSRSKQPKLIVDPSVFQFEEGKLDRFLDFIAELLAEEWQREHGLKHGPTIEKAEPKVEIRTRLQAKGKQRQRYMSTAEVAEYLGFSKQTVWRWAREGTIPCYRVRSAYRFKLSEVEAWMQKRRQKNYLARFSRERLT